MHILRNLLIAMLVLFPATVVAQVVPAQNQIILSPYGSNGFVVSTSSSGTAKLSASSTPFFANFFATNGNIKNLTVTSCTGCGGSSSFPFTPFPSYNATSTAIGFLAGLFSNSSTTLNGTIHFPSLSAGGLAVDGLGNVYTGATTTFSSGLTYSNGNVTNTGVTSITATSPLVRDVSTGAVTISCPSCSVSSGAAYPFTPGTFGVTNTSATSTAINDTAGFISTASSTLFNLTMLLSTTTSATTTNLAITGTAANCNGTSALTTNSTGGVTCTAQPQGTVTAVSIASSNGFAGSSGGGATPILTITTTVTGLTLGNGTALSAYGGTSCTYAILSLNASGAATCGGSGHPFVYATTYNTLSAGTSTPLWLQGTPFSLFASSTVVLSNSTTTKEAEGTDTINNWTGRISPTRSFALVTGTSTVWQGTTSLAYVPAIVAPFAGTLRQTRCMASTTSSFLGVTFYINTTKVSPTYFVASTTVGTIKFTSNNTFVAGDKISMLVGTTTTDSNALFVSCTSDTTETP